MLLSRRKALEENYCRGDLGKPILGKPIQGFYPRELLCALRRRGVLRFWGKYSKRKVSELHIEKPLQRFSTGEPFLGETYRDGDVIAGGLHRGAAVGLSTGEPLWEPLQRAHFLGKRPQAAV